jgi:hypothetical protein
MSKTTITWVFVGGVMAIVAGAILSLATVLAAIAGGVIIVEGSEVVGVNGGTLAWSLVGLVIGMLAIVGGSIATLAAWIGALLNTVQLDDKTWFVLLLVLGLFSFGFLAMIAYVIAGPDGSKQPVIASGIAPAGPISS